MRLVVDMFLFADFSTQICSLYGDIILLNFKVLRWKFTSDRMNKSNRCFNQNGRRKCFLFYSK